MEAPKDRLGVTAADLATLAPGRWLNDQVINCFMAIINRRSVPTAGTAAHAGADTPGADPPANARPVHAFNSFLFSKFCQHGFDGVKRWTKKVDLLSKELLLVPVNVGNEHWVLLAADLKRKRISCYDSLGGRHKKKVGQLRAYLASELRARGKDASLEGWVDEPTVRGIPQQTNGVDCGVFVCKFADVLSRSQPLQFPAKDMLSRYRK